MSSISTLRIDTFTDKEINALKLYSDELYDNLNLYLMGVDLKQYLKYTDPDELRDYVNTIDNVFYKARMQGSVGYSGTLYRGKKRDFPSGEHTFHMKAYSSTSIDVNSALEFTNNRCCLYVMDVDSDVAYIDLYTNNFSLKDEDEKEILLERNLFYHIYHTNNQYQDNHIQTYYIFISKTNEFPSRDKIQILKQKYNLVGSSGHGHGHGHGQKYDIYIQECIERFNQNVRDDLGDVFNEDELSDFLFNKENDEHLEYLSKCILEKTNDKIEIEKIRDMIGGKERNSKKYTRKSTSKSRKYHRRSKKRQSNNKNKHKHKHKIKSRSKKYTRKYK
jgi:hypothetical protein